MLWADMDMRAVDPALQLRPETFDPVHGRAFAADILARIMLDRHVPIMGNPAKRGVTEPFVGMDFSAGLNKLGNDGKQRRAGTVRNDASDNFTVALFYPEHDGFALTGLRAALVPTDIGFVRFNYGADPAQRIVAIQRPHVFADFVAHAPSGFVGHADLALNFLGSDAVTRRAELEHDEEPIAQAGAGAVKGGSCGRIDLRSAPFASIRATGLHAVKASVLAALVALVALAKTNTHQVIEAAFFGRKAVLKLAESGGFAHA